VGLEDRDWYREESSRAYWRESDRASSARSGAGSRSAGGLFAAVCLSAIVALAGMNGYLPRIKLSPSGSGTPARESSAESAGQTTARVKLGSLPGFDRRGPAGRRWCLSLATGRVCAVTGTAESGREALTRTLRARGITVAP
jgi:hypothetical protein